MNGMGLLRCMCDETRFGILETLQESGEMCVGDLVGALGRDQPLVSHHLRILKECGIVKSRGDGRRVMYSISGVEMAELVSGIAEAGRRIPVLCGGKGCC